MLTYIKDISHLEQDNPSGDNHEPYFASNFVRFDF